MSHTRFYCSVFCAAIVLFLLSPANATIVGTVNIQNHNNAISDQGQLWGGGLTGGAYYTGIYSWTNAGGIGAGIDVPNWGFCIELTQGAFNGWQDVIYLQDAPVPPMYGTPMGMTKANYIRELWGRFFDPAWETGANTQMAEAFNMAMYEIIYETDPVWDVTSGTGFYCAGVEQAATSNLWLSELTGNSAYFANNLVATSTLDGQDYLVEIPEPATLALLAAGTLAMLRRKIK